MASSDWIVHRRIKADPSADWISELADWQPTDSGPKSAESEYLLAVTPDVECNYQTVFGYRYVVINDNEYENCR